MNLSQALYLFRGVILAIAVSIPLIMIPYYKSTTDFFLVFGGVLIMLACAIPIFVRSNYNILEPLTILIFLVIQSITIKICLVIAYQNDQSIASFLLMGRPPAFMLRGLWIMLIGYLFLALGYLLPSPVFKSRRYLFLNDRTVWSQKRFMYGVGSILLISTIAFLLFANSLGINLNSIFANASAKRFTDLQGDSGQGASQRLQFAGYYYYRIAHFARYAFYIAITFSIATKARLLSFTNFMVFVSFLVSAFLVYFTSDRSGMGWLILEAVFIIVLLRKKINFSYILVIPALILLMSTLILAERSERRTEQSVQEILTSTFGGKDLIDFTKTCQIIDHVPNTMPYEYGQSLYSWLFAPIPKSIWPNKPLFMEQGNIVAIKVYGQSGISGVYPGLPAELFWNFDFFGVWLGLMFFGWMQRSIFVNFYPSKSTPTSVLIYVIILTHFTVYTFAHSWGFGVLKIILNILPINLALIYIAKKPRTLVSRT